MTEGDTSRGWAVGGDRSPVVLVTRLSTATGAKAAAAALACATSEPDRAALLIDLDDGRPPRPSLIATAGARELEERLVAHLPDAGIASRGQICHLTLPADPEGVERIAAALPLVRESAGIVHLPPGLVRPLLDETRIRPTAVLLRADLAADRALAALAARDLMAKDLRVAVLKRPVGRLTARAALLGALPASVEALPIRLCKRLIESEDSKFHRCYDEKDGLEGDRQENSQEQEPARARWWRESRRPGEGQGGA